jgi:hypothetical protein
MDAGRGDRRRASAAKSKFTTTVIRVPFDSPAYADSLRAGSAPGGRESRSDFVIVEEQDVEVGERLSVGAGSSALGAREG